MPNSPATVPFSALLAWRDIETARWRSWLEANPAAFDLPAGDDAMGMDTVRGVVRHIFAVELRSAQRLLGEPATELVAFTQQDLADIFAIGEEARGKVDRYLAAADGRSLGGAITFQTLSAGMMTATRRKLLLHFVTHGVRHWAQLATLVRLGGLRASWLHDVLPVEVGM